MRIIAGLYKRRKLSELKGRKIRPTSDKIREALFSILSGRVENAFVLDLFAGTGAFGIEALSRGALKSFFVDNSRQAVDMINKNLELLDIKDKAEVYMQDACRIAGSKNIFNNKFDLIFLDPPYDKGLISSVFSKANLSGITNDDAVVVAEYSARESDPGSAEGFEFFDKRAYGETLISFYRKIQAKT